MKARLGQNFLYQPQWQQRVAGAVNPRPDQMLVEIGGGPGDISELLAETAGDLTVIEYDRGLAQALERRLAGRGNVRVLAADVLTVDFSAVAESAREGMRARGCEPAPGARLRVFGNLPYYITSPILLHLFGAAPALSDAVLMVQREVADRILATPGHSAFGLLAATTQLYARPRRLFQLPPHAFRPAPKVESTLLALEFVERAAELGVEANAFSSFLRVAFAQKRKTLANSLQTRYPGAAARAALETAGLEPRIRAEQLTLEQLAAVYRALSEGVRAPG